MAAKTTTTATKRRLVDSTNNSKAATTTATTETSPTTTATPETTTSSSCNGGTSGPSSSVIVSATSFSSESSSSTTSTSSSASVSASHDDVADVDTAPSKKKTTSYHSVPTIPWSVIQITEATTAAATATGSKRKKKTSGGSESSTQALTTSTITLAQHPHHPSLTGFHYLEATVLPPHPLSGFDYYILQQQKQDVDVAKLLEKIPQHPNILQVHAQVRDEGSEKYVTAAGDLLVVDPWEETLRQRIVRLQQQKQQQKKKTSSSKSKSSSSSSDTTATMQMIISEIGLPLIRVLKHLHHSNPRYAVSYNVLCKDSVGFVPVKGGQQGPSSPSSNGVVKQGPSTSTNLVLIDFSKATVSSSSISYHHRESDEDLDSVSTPREEEESQYYTYMNNQLEESFDVWCYGKLLREVLVALHVMPSSTTESNNNDPMSVLLEDCCHSRPSQRPTLSRIHKRLLELYKPLSASSSPAVMVASTTAATTSPTTTSPKNLPRFKIGGWNWMTTKLQRSPKKTSAGNKTTHNNESIDISSLMTTASMILGKDEEKDHSDST